MALVCWAQRFGRTVSNTSRRGGGGQLREGGGDVIGQQAHAGQRPRIGAQADADVVSA